jgi:hypothetical protein
MIQDNSIKQMIKTLSKKLTKDEFVSLYQIIDENDNNFYDAMGEKCVEIAPELFSDEDNK